MTSFQLALAVIVYLSVAIVVFARRRPAYSHVRDTISDLGAIGTPGWWGVSLGVFLPVGVALLVIASLERFSHPAQIALAASLAMGYLVAAFFPEGPASSVFGHLRRGIHYFGGGIEYVGGTLALFWLSELLGPAFQVAGFAVGLATIGISFESPWRGLIQRIAEICLFGGLALSLWMIG